MPRPRRPRHHTKANPELFPQTGYSDSQSGLLGWLEETRVRLPLRAVDCRFDVLGMIAEVEVCQVFVQDNSEVLDCVYTFALPAGAAVHQCLVEINGRRISARSEERQKARELAAEKAAQGYRTALVETERDNVFTLTLGNVAPGDLVVVRLAWFQVADQLGEERSLTIPFTPGVRFIPGKPLLRENRGVGVIDDTDAVPDASRISPPRVQGDHPDSATLFIHGSIRHPESSSLEVTSPSDLLRVLPETGCSLVALAEAETSKPFPDVDFVIRWTESCVDTSGSAGTGWYSDTKGDFDHALIHLVAPEIERPEDFSQDIYFLVDRSGSMGGSKWDQATRALKGFVDLMGNGDRVFITFFETAFEDFSEAPLPVEEVAADRYFQAIENLGTAGGTNLLPALQHQLEILASHSEGRNVSLLLITDGQVGNEEEVFNALGVRPDLRIHVFGIDTNVNDAFLRKLARDYRGTCCLRTPSDDIAGAVTELGAIIGRPALRSVSLDPGWETTGGLPGDLYSGQSLTLPIRRRQDGAVKPDEVTLVASLPSNGEVRIPVKLQLSESPAIELIWIRERIDHLLAEGSRQEAIELAIQHNLICEGVAFVAWDEAEKVPVSGPVPTLIQPSATPPMLMASPQVSSAFERIDHFDEEWHDTDLDKSPNIADTPPIIDNSMVEVIRRLVQCGAIAGDRAVDVYLVIAEEMERPEKMTLWKEMFHHLAKAFEALRSRQEKLRSLVEHAAETLAASRRRPLIELGEFFEESERLRSIWRECHQLLDEIHSLIPRFPDPLSAMLRDGFEDAIRRTDHPPSLGSGEQAWESSLRMQIEKRL